MTQLVVARIPGSPEPSVCPFWTDTAECVDPEEPVMVWPDPAVVCVPDGYGGCQPSPTPTVPAVGVPSVGVPVRPAGPYLPTTGPDLVLLVGAGAALLFAGAVLAALGWGWLRRVRR